MKRRFWAGLLFFVMLWSLLPASALAAEEGTPEPGKVTATKTASTLNSDGTYTITLMVQGNPVEDKETTTASANADVVLVVDNSGSMESSVGEPCQTPKSQFEKINATLLGTGVVVYKDPDSGSLPHFYLIRAGFAAHGLAPLCGQGTASPLPAYSVWGETPQSDIGVCDMARFTNYATLSYNGGTTDSNTVTGELLATLSMTKTAVMDDYTQKDDVTYVISLVNGGTTAVTGLTVTDDLGGYTLGENTVYPLAYTDGSLRYYVNGVLQAAPAVTAGPPLVVTGVSIPAGGNALLIYETSVTNYAPLGPEATITNTATVTGNGFDQTAQETIAMEPRADLSISKALCPVTVTENGQLTYTFVIENAGNVAAAAADNVVLTDTFDPKLNSIAVTFNGAPWSEGVNYTYDTTTGLFQTLPGQITVPAATYTQKTDGTWTVTPGVAVLTVTGTV